MNDDQIIIAPDAKEKIEQALKDRVEAATKKWVPRNRAERRALKKRMGARAFEEFDVISDTARKLDYIDLIQKFRELNEKKKDEVYEDEQATED